MFNNYSKSYYNPTTKNIMNINAVSGTMIKTNINSRITMLELNSDEAKDVFSTEIPRLKMAILKEGKEHNFNFLDHQSFYNNYNSSYIIEKVEIVLLQIMLCGDNRVMIEYIDRFTYENQLKKLHTETGEENV